MSASRFPATGESETTVGALLSRLRAQFAQAGVDAPGRDARLILAAVLGCDGARLHAHPERAVPADALRRAEALARRRARREPMAYIMGEREFWSLPFLVSPDVLIPRPESELLVERAAALLGGRRSPRLLDLGAGSGAVGLAVGRELPGARITLADICPRALRVAKRNARRLGLERRTAFVASDLLGAIAGGQAFDLIASNPPYVVSGEVDGLMPEVSAHEPRLALDGGADGMACIRRVIAGAPQHLARGGFLLLEMDPRQVAEARALAARCGEYSEAKPRPDLAGRERVLELRRA